MERLCDLNEGGLGDLARLMPVGKVSGRASEDVVASSSQRCCRLDEDFGADSNVQTPERKIGRIETRQALPKSPDLSIKFCSANSKVQACYISAIHLL